MGWRDKCVQTCTRKVLINIQTIHNWNLVLAANGFFANGNRVTEAVLQNGDLDDFFTKMEELK